LLRKIFFSFIVLYAILGFFIIPYVAKPKVIEIVAKQTNAKIDIESIYFNPFVFNLKISGLKLSDLDNKELLYLKSIQLDLELYSLINSAIHIKTFILEEPRISLVLDKNKKINFTSVVKPSKEVKKESDSKPKIPRIIIDRVAIVDGSLNYEDYSQKSKFEFNLDTIGFELRDIDTKNIQTSDAKLRFYTLLSDGGFFDLKSKIIGLDPLVVEGSLDFQASKLYTQWRYMKDSLNLEVADGKLTLYTDYYFNIDDLESTTLSNLSMNLSKLRIKPKGYRKDILTLSSFSVANTTIKPMLQNIYIKDVNLESLSIKVKRDEKKIIDWLEYIKTVPKNEKIQKEKVVEIQTKEESKPWKLLVDKIALEKIKIDFEDSGVKPQVNTKLNEFNFYAQNVTLSGLEPLKYQMNLVLNDKFKCNSNGDVIHSILDLKSYTKCIGFDVVHYRPYIDEIAKSKLKVYDVKLEKLATNFDINLSVKDINSTMVIDINEANLKLNQFVLNKKSTNKKLVSFNRFSIKGIKLNSLKKEIDVDYVGLKYLNIKTSKLEDGSLNIENLIVSNDEDSNTKSDKIVKKTKVEKPYRIKLKKLAMLGAKVSFEDKVLKPSVTSVLDGIYLSAYNIDSQKNSWLDYSFNMRVNKKGTVKSKGRVRHTPLKQKGKLQIQRISLSDLTPYVRESAFVTVDDGYFSLKSDISYSLSDKKPDIIIKGSSNIDKFFVTDSRDNSPLISFNTLDLKNFTVEVSPNRMFIDELDIDRFFVDAIIDENKQMNFASLVKNSDTNESVKQIDTIAIQNQT